MKLISLEEAKLLGVDVIIRRINNTVHILWKDGTRQTRCQLNNEPQERTITCVQRAIDYLSEQLDDSRGLRTFTVMPDRGE